MRNLQRELTEEQAVELLKKSSYAFVASVDNEGIPYCIPINIFSPDGKNIYFHTGSEGKKIENIKNQPKVSVSNVLGFKVEQHPYNPLGYQIFYESFVADGIVSLVTGYDEKLDILTKICRNSIPEKLPAYENVVNCAEKSVDRVTIYKIAVNQISGKKAPKNYES